MVPRILALSIILTTLPPSVGANEPKRASPLDPLVRLLGQTIDADVQCDVLKGMHAGLLGRRQAAMPAEWPTVVRMLYQSSKPEVRELALGLSLIFGDPEAVTILRKTAADVSVDTASRRNAIQALVQKKDPEFVSVLQSLLTDEAMRGPALRGLATYAADNTPGLILKHYASFTPAERADAVQTLAGRLAYARVLVGAVESGTIAAGDLNAFTVRQLHGLGDKQLSEKLSKIWGAIRSPSKEKASLIARYKKLLTPNLMKQANRAQGRLVFSRTCAACHVLFDEGGKVGPELTGSQRTNVDYVLENMIDPSAVVAKEYQVTIVYTKDGRVINGIVRAEDDRSVSLQTPNDLVILPKNEIEQREQSHLSLMPEGLLDKMTTEEVRDLVAYLAGPGQVPLPKEGANKIEQP